MENIKPKFNIGDKVFMLIEDPDSSGVNIRYNFFVCAMYEKYGEIFYDLKMHEDDKFPTTINVAEYKIHTI